MKLTISKLAKQSGVNIETIRHYQRKGLLTKPEKTAIGFRQYPISTIARIRFIKRAQQTGFTLLEISELLSLDSGQCADVRKLAEQKRRQIDTQINDLRRLRDVLDNLVKGCQDDPSTEHCSLITALSNPSDSAS